MKEIAAVREIENRIVLIRGKKVMLDRDLARLYGVKTKRLNEQVKRNIKRFPEDFMIKLTEKEALTLHNWLSDSRSQIATLKRGENIKYLPYAFTEQGVAMLSTVLNSERAIQVNIAIMRAFVKLREILSTHKELALRLNDLERKIENHDKEIRSIFEAIRQLMAPPTPKPKQITGFRQKESRRI